MLVLIQLTVVKSLLQDLCPHFDHKSLQSAWFDVWHRTLTKII